MLLLFFSTCQVANAQRKTASFTIRGTVSERQNHSNKIPVPSASIHIDDYGASTNADLNGKFSFQDVPAGKIKLSVKMLGKITLDTLINVHADLNLDIYLSDADFRLQEVAVTARNVQGGNGTSSKISRMAIDHLQANSLADVMSLLPGATTINPNLNSSKQISIRNLADDNTKSQNSNSFGTAIVMNGAPLSNNANLQAMSPTVAGGTAPIGGGASPGAGFDVRNVSMDNVESVEVIRGVPGVEYGDITSGVVLVNTKAGEQPLRISAHTNPNISQISLTKGTDLGPDKGALNLGLDYAYNVNDPVQSYLFYQRLTGTALYTNTFFKRLNSTSSIDLMYGKDTRKLNPDDQITQSRSSARDLGFIFNTRGAVNFENLWLRNLNYVARVGYTTKNGYAESLNTAANAPYSATLTDGAILSNKPNTDIFDSKGNKLTNISEADKLGSAFYLPSTYLGRYDINGKELNTYLKANTTFFNKIGTTNHKWILGADFKADKNYGEGKTFSSAAPPYRNLSAVNASFRPRAYKDIPGVNQLGLFAEENFSADLGSRRLNIIAGLRYDHFSGNSNTFSPRVNAMFDLLPNTLSVHAAYGQLAKAPAILYLHPENAYFEYININETASSSIPVEQQVLMTTTRVFNTENEKLQITKNEKAELGFQLNIKQSTLTVTAFRERLRNGYSFDYATRPVTFNEYTRAGDGTEAVYDLKESNSVLAKYTMPGNNFVSNTKGIEIELDLGRFSAINSSFSLNGAWIRNESYNKNYFYFDDYSGAGGSARTHIALYEPGMLKDNEERLVTALRSTHNIPSIGFVVTLTTQVSWREISQTKHGNDSIPLKYISKDDGLTYNFDPARKNEAAFKDLIRPVNERVYIKESFPAMLSFNLNLTKEIADYMRVSFFANNMLRSYQITESKQQPGTYYRRNEKLFFGLGLTLTIK